MTGMTKLYFYKNHLQDVVTGIGILLAIAIAAFLFSLQPEIHGGKQHFKNYPNTKMTGKPKPPAPIKKEELIIQQNPHCWIGAPGVTCGPERTYA